MASRPGRRRVARAERSGSHSARRSCYLPIISSMLDPSTAEVMTAAVAMARPQACAWHSTALGMDMKRERKKNMSIDILDPVPDHKRELNRDVH